MLSKASLNKGFKDKDKEREMSSISPFLKEEQEEEYILLTKYTSLRSMEEKFLRSLTEGLKKPSSQKKNNSDYKRNEKEKEKTHEKRIFVSPIAQTNVSVQYRS